MRRATVSLVGSLFLLAACGDDPGGTADATPTPSTNSVGDALVIRTRVNIAAEAGAEPIATGKVLEGSTLGDSPFCVGGTIVDSHGSTDPSVWLIVETITCPDGTVKLEFTPDVAQGRTQTGSWTILHGTGTFDGLRGSGEMEVVYGSDESSPTLVTFTGTVTR